MGFIKYRECGGSNELSGQPSFFRKPQILGRCICASDVCCWVPQSELYKSFSFGNVDGNTRRYMITGAPTNRRTQGRHEELAARLKSGPVVMETEMGLIRSDTVQVEDTGRRRRRRGKKHRGVFVYISQLRKEVKYLTTAADVQQKVWGHEEATFGSLEDHRRLHILPVTWPKTLVPIPHQVCLIPALKTLQSGEKILDTVHNRKVAAPSWGQNKVGMGARTPAGVRTLG